MQLEKKFAEAIAPGQSDDLVSQVLRNDNKNVEKIPGDLVVPLRMFKESDSVGQIMVLAVIDHTQYTKVILIDVFGCKKHQIDQARKLQKENAGLSLPQKGKITRCRMSEHFLEFMFSRNLLQDVAYIINRIKFESGEEQKVANAILTMKFSHTIAFSKETCREVRYVPM